jgi:hypothetical protein
MSGRFRRLPTDDSGASLVIAMAFVAFVGLVAGALLAYGGTAVRGAASTKYRADVVYDVDGALQAGINQLRNSTYADPAAACDANGSAAGTTLSFPASNLGKAIAVTCAGGPLTGAAAGPVKIGGANKPGYAMLTLATAEQGIHMQGTGGAFVLPGKGSAYVDSAASANPGTIDFTGPFTARGTCSGITSPVKSCSGSNPVVADPGASSSDYDVPVPAGGELTHASAPPCPGGAARVVSLTPGYYDDAAALDALTNGGCGAHTVWFQPGVYYFDFHNGVAGDHVWTIGDSAVRVVGGASSGWTPATVGAAGPTIPGACVSPIASPAAGMGVAFVFGGDSRLVISGGATELCGQYSTAKPPFVLYGSKSDVGTTTTVSRNGASDGTGSTPAGMLPFLLPNLVVGEGLSDLTSALATVPDVNSVSSAGIILKDFATTPNVPAGSVLTNALLLVTHREFETLGSVGVPEVTVTPKRAGASQLTVPALTKHTGGYVRDTIDITSVLADEVRDHGLTGLTLQYSATAAKKVAAVLGLDYVALQLTWKPSPVLRAESGCIVAPTCALISGPGDSAIAYFQGTTYAPKATLDIDLKKDARLDFGWGLIVRSIDVKTYGNTSQTTPIVSVPEDALGPSATDVYFKAYTCPDPTCSTAAPLAPWKLAGTARASYKDVDPLHPSTGSREVTVQSWTTYR